MNLEYIFKTQVKLDQAILSNVEESQKTNIKIKATIALLVELGEFANEVQAFKYWKKHKKINQEKLLEEFADGIHFLTSFANDVQLNPEIEIILKSNDFSLQLSYTYTCFTKLLNEYNYQNIKEAYGAYLGLGKLANIEYNDILNAYLNKNLINYKRIENNY
ncbi:Uncharacterized protein conserved in bacteria [Metamycoplasma cloacale]|uniref:Uncharacterized protein n=1 Tax=Metamycoplasma cloacale TaxID=92401 RepID=A0A2Z4LLU4_9BACT|nr:dUTP diphosphatase [Metamycoplasma cloacale]AWX42654.1 hypothetical protein DK849_00970 [Metamycoplasma cloacale]VEU79547.1 Uncharacterized protein conserved in bacteria [Metamycoplasma cloacale]